VDKSKFFEKFSLSFDHFFEKEKASLKEAEEKGLLANQQILQPSSLGRFFLRNIAALFDSYYEKRPKQYAKGI